MNGKKRRNVIDKRQADTLIETARRLGATGAGVIATADIAVREDLAQLCSANPGCEQYALAPSCPPHVAGPAGFRKWQRTSAHAVVVRIDVPAAALFSHQRRQIMRLLHEVVAGVEKKAVEMGFGGSKAFAGGSCKMIFCHDQTTCPVLAETGGCRHPAAARPSMSGFGIDVAALMRAAGWTAETASAQLAPDENSTTWVAGLILIDTKAP